MACVVYASDSDTASCNALINTAGLHQAQHENRARRDRRKHLSSRIYVAPRHQCAARSILVSHQAHDSAHPTCCTCQTKPEPTHTQTPPQRQLQQTRQNRRCKAHHTGQCILLKQATDTSRKTAHTTSRYNQSLMRGSYQLTCSYQLRSYQLSAACD